MNSKITRLSRISRAFYKRHKRELLDIILFGSLIRGKTEPNDIDVLLLFTLKVDKEIELAFRGQCKEKNLDLLSKTVESCQQETFLARDSLLFEGYSLVQRRFLAAQYEHTSFGLFFYATKDLSNTRRTRFYYALNGRTSLGMVERLQAIKLSDSILAVPLSTIEPARLFFEHWNLPFRYVPVLLPERMARKHILAKVI